MVEFFNYPTLPQYFPTTTWFANITAFNITICQPCPTHMLQKGSLARCNVAVAGGIAAGKWMLHRFVEMV